MQTSVSVNGWFPAVSLTLNPTQAHQRLKTFPPRPIHRASLARLLLTSDSGHEKLFGTSETQERGNANAKA